jgi:hypothetical protein
MGRAGACAPGEKQPVHDLLRDPAHGLHVIGRDLIPEAVEGGHESGGGHAAEKSIPFDKECLRPGAGRGQRGDDAARAAARDHDISVIDNWQFSCRLEYGLHGRCPFLAEEEYRDLLMMKHTCFCGENARGTWVIRSICDVENAAIIFIMHSGGDLF